jgi:Holliday junction resolvase RusA-like endonuclease
VKADDNPSVAFTITGRPCLNNRVYRHVAGKALKSAEAREYQARIRSLAEAAVLLARWTHPLGAHVSIDVFNSRGDIDSFPKCILDGMIGPVYPDDRCIRKLTIEKYLDDGPERVRVTVRATGPLVRQKFRRRTA